MTGERFLNRAAVVEMVGLSVSEIHRQVTAGLFPRSRPYPNGSRRRFWLQSEIEAWQRDALAWGDSPTKDHA